MRERAFTEAELAAVLAESRQRLLATAATVKATLNRIALNIDTSNASTEKKDTP